MNVRQVSHRVIAELKCGEEVLSCLREICLKRKISYAKVTAIGTLYNVCTVNEKSTLKGLGSKKIGLLSGTSLLSGYIAKRPEGIYINLYIYIKNGKEEYLARLDSAYVKGLCEVVIDIVDGVISEDALKQSCFY